MTITESIEDIKAGVTQRQSLNVAVRALEGYELMKEYLQSRKEQNGDSISIDEVMDLIISTEERAENNN